MPKYIAQLFTCLVQFAVLLLCLADPSSIVVPLLGMMALATVCHGLFALPLGTIGRL